MMKGFVDKCIMNENIVKAKSEMKFGMEVTDEKWYGNRN